ncbi:hypothetical protein TruAng_007221 [Truncatella angustata]|nr:hypothetical protein TruAng_007221 [Truncatella angustata]
MSSSKSSRPKTSSQPTTTWNSLPLELRLVVWECALPSGRTLVIGCQQWYSMVANRAILPPTISHVCKEARDVALKHGRPRRLTDINLNTWFDPSRDRVLLEGSPVEPSYLPSIRPLSRDVEHLIFQAEWTVDFDEGVTWMIGFNSPFVQFPNLKDCGVIRVGKNGRKPWNLLKGKWTRARRCMEHQWMQAHLLSLSPMTTRYDDKGCDWLVCGDTEIWPNEESSKAWVRERVANMPRFWPVDLLDQKQLGI